MKRLLVGMGLHKEKNLVVGLPGEGSHPALRAGTLQFMRIPAMEE